MENNTHIPKPGAVGYWEAARINGSKVLKEAREQQVEGFYDPDIDKKGIGGRKKVFPTPESLWVVACDYFQETEEEFWSHKEFIKGGEKAGELTNEKKLPVPFLWEGLDFYLNMRGYIGRLDHYRVNSEQKYNEYRGVIQMIKNVIFKRNASGASAGVFNANIISRQLGLMEQTMSTLKSEVKISNDVDYSQLSDEALEEINRARKDQ